MPWRLENASLDFWNCAFFLQQFPTYTTRGNGRTSLLVSFGPLPYYSQLEFQKSYQTTTIW